MLMSEPVLLVRPARDGGHDAPEQGEAEGAGHYVYIDIVEYAAYSAAMSGTT